MKDNLKPIKSISLMTWLIKHGFNLINVVDDYKNPRFHVFLFKKSDELEKSIHEFDLSIKK